MARRLNRFPNAARQPFAALHPTGGARIYQMLNNPVALPIDSLTNNNMPPCVISRQADPAIEPTKKPDQQSSANRTEKLAPWDWRKFMCGPVARPQAAISNPSPAHDCIRTTP